METLQRNLVEAAMAKGCSFDYIASVPVLVIYRVDILTDDVQVIGRVYTDSPEAETQIHNLLAILDK